MRRVSRPPQKSVSPLDKLAFPLCVFAPRDASGTGRPRRLLAALPSELLLLAGAAGCRLLPRRPPHISREVRTSRGAALSEVRRPVPEMSATDDVARRALRKPLVDAEYFYRADYVQPG
jgi:hypothetical protein